MSYEIGHTEEMCDKCCKIVGKKNLQKVPFLYLDRNDQAHPDMSELVGAPKGFGYRQYFCCKNCINKC